MFTWLGLPMYAKLLCFTSIINLWHCRYLSFDVSKNLKRMYLISNQFLEFGKLSIR